MRAQGGKEPNSNDCKLGPQLKHVIIGSKTIKVLDAIGVSLCKKRLLYLWMVLCCFSQVTASPILNSTAAELLLHPVCVCCCVAAHSVALKVAVGPLSTAFT